MGLKSFDKEIKLLKNSYNKTNFFINNETIIDLSGTESGYEILMAFDKDLKRNISLINTIIDVIKYPEEYGEEDIDIEKIQLIKTKPFQELLEIKSKTVRKEKITEILLNEFFKNTGNKEEIIRYKRIYNKPKYLKLIYDASDIYDFIKYTSDRVRTNKLAEAILDEKARKIEAWEEKHYFDIYASTFQGKNATVYMEKQTSVILKKGENGKFELIQNKKNLNIYEELLEELNSSIHIHSIEIDEEYFLTRKKELRRVLKELKTIKDILKWSFYLKFRKLGRHKATGITYPTLNILALDVETPSALMHELGHLIHLNGEFTKKEEYKIYSFTKYNDYSVFNENKMREYSSVAEVIARAIEFTYALYKADFANVYEAYKSKKEYNGELINGDNFIDILKRNSIENTITQSLEEYSNGLNNNIYFDLNNRTPEELLEFYILLQKTFKFEKQLEKEEDIFKTENINRLLDFHNRKKSIRRKRKYIRGIKSYNLEIVKLILKEYENGNVEAMNKEEFLTNLLMSDDFKYKNNLYKLVFVNNEEYKISEEEKENIQKEILKRLLFSEDLRKHKRLLENLVSENIIPKELEDRFNILTIENFELSKLEEYYIKYKEGLLIVKQPNKDTDIKEYKKYLGIMKYLEVYSKKTNGIVELSKDAIFDENFKLTVGEGTYKYLGNGSKYIATGEYMLFPTNEKNKLVRIKIKDTIVRNREEDLEEKLIEYKDKTEEKYIIEIMDRNESRFIDRKGNFLFINKETKEMFSYSSDNIDIVDFKIKENKLFINGKETLYIISERPPRITIYKEEEDRLIINGKQLIKQYKEPEIKLRIMELFKNGLLKIIDGENNAEEKINEYFNFFQRKNSEKDFLPSDILYTEPEKKEKIKKILLKNILKNMLRTDLSETMKLFKDKAEEVMMEYMNIYDIRQADIKLLIPNFENEQIENINIFLKEIYKMLEEVKKELLKDIEEQKDINKEVKEEVKTYVEFRIIEIFKRIYPKINEEREYRVKEEINNMIKYLFTKEDKIEISKIMNEISKTEDKMDNDLRKAYLKIKEQFKTSKAKKTVSDIIKLFIDNINTNINEKYDLENKNIFHYIDNSFRRNTKTAISDKKILKKLSNSKNLNKVIELISSYNKEFRIDINNFSPYNSGFGLLEKTLNEVREEGQSKKIKR